MNEELRARWRKAVELLDRCPDGIYTHMSSVGVGIDFQAWTQAEVKTIRQCFPGVVWQKAYCVDNMWTYDTTFDGIKLHIYACKEAPPTCHAIEEKYETQEYDFGAATPPPMKTVTKTRIKWICDGEAN